MIPEIHQFLPGEVGTQSTLGHQIPGGSAVLRYFWDTLGMPPPIPVFCLHNRAQLKDRGPSKKMGLRILFICYTNPVKVNA